MPSLLSIFLLVEYSYQNQELPCSWALLLLTGCLDGSTPSFLSLCRLGVLCSEVLDAAGVTSLDLGPAELLWRLVAERWSLPRGNEELQQVDVTDRWGRGSEAGGGL